MRKRNEDGGLVTFPAEAETQMQARTYPCPLASPLPPRSGCVISQALTMHPRPVLRIQYSFLSGLLIRQ